MVDVNDEWATGVASASALTLNAAGADVSNVNQLGAKRFCTFFVADDGQLNGTEALVSSDTGIWPRGLFNQSLHFLQTSIQLVIFNIVNLILNDVKTTELIWLKLRTS